MTGINKVSIVDKCPMGKSPATSPTPLALNRRGILFPWEINTLQYSPSLPLSGVDTGFFEGGGAEFDAFEKNLVLEM